MSKTEKLLDTIDGALAGVDGGDPLSTLEHLRELAQAIELGRVRVEREIGKQLALLDSAQVDRHHVPKQAKVWAAENLDMSSQAYCASVSLGQLSDQDWAAVERWISGNYQPEPKSPRAIIRALDRAKKSKEKG